MTTFVGRRREITRTKRLLAESRLVTLTGPGGVGKTRLALRVAANMRRGFRDKAWCVELEDLRDGSLLADAVIEQLNLGGPAPRGDVSSVVNKLKHREMLLVLDNCEHLVDDVALLARNVIRWCPGVRVLATSRQSLGVAGESTMVVPPLQVPDIEHLPAPESYEQFASVRLFVDRARAAVPEFEVTADNGAELMRLCHYLDGNPLAIELAAVRLRSLSLHQLEERLTERYELLTEGRRGAPARQQTLRALIDWSYDLCSAQDQTAWARVSVFSGSFALEAAEYVASDGLSSTDVLGAVHSLVDKSILLREEELGQVRFRLLHSMREYGQEKLAAAGEQERVQQRHCDWYAGMVERFAAEWVGAQQVTWVSRLRDDQGNLRLALHEAAIDPARAPVALSMAVRLGNYWGIRGLNAEARYWLDQALATAPESAPERASALRVSAWFAVLQGDLDPDEPLLRQAEELAVEHELDSERVYITQVRGMSAALRGELDRATELLEAALTGFRERELLDGELFALHGLGMTHGLNGAYDDGLALLNECIRIAGDLGELFWRSYALWSTAEIEVRRERLEPAETASKEALRLQRRLDNRLGAALNIDTLAWITQEYGRNERAARLFGAAAAVWDAVRSAPGFYSTFEQGHVEHERRARAALGEQSYLEAFERGYQLSPSAAVDYALEVKKQSRGDARENVHPMPLTRREREIAELVAQGRTNKEIAESLVIAQRTVEGHVQHILTKLDFSSRAQIAGWVAAQHGGGQQQ